MFLHHKLLFGIASFQSILHILFFPMRPKLRTINSMSDTASCIVAWDLSWRLNEITLAIIFLNSFDTLFHRHLGVRHLSLLDTSFRISLSTATPQYYSQVQSLDSGLTCTFWHLSRFQAHIVQPTKSMQRFFFPIDLHLRDAMQIESSIGHDIEPDPYFTADCKVLYLTLSIRRIFHIGCLLFSLSL